MASLNWYRAWNIFKCRWGKFKKITLCLNCFSCFFSFFSWFCPPTSCTPAVATWGVLQCAHTRNRRTHAKPDSALGCTYVPCSVHGTDTLYRYTVHMYTVHIHCTLLQCTMYNVIVIVVYMAQIHCTDTQCTCTLYIYTVHFYNAYCISGHSPCWEHTAYHTLSIYQPTTVENATTLGKGSRWFLTMCFSILFNLFMTTRHQSQASPYPQDCPTSTNSTRA